MKKFQRNFFLSVAMLAATFVGWIKGNEAKQKLVYKWRTNYEEKRELAKKRIASRQGQVQLDDIEWQSFHNS
ncbi:MAG: hypothetical protein H7Y27_05245 [Gemmatimonadaceae bacterium]|nr:hypothetical protein [Chitinophagaceae bacterium]